MTVKEKAIEYFNELDLPNGTRRFIRYFEEMMDIAIDQAKREERHRIIDLLIKNGQIRAVSLLK